MDYSEVLEDIEVTIEGESDLIANTANISAILHNALKNRNVNWVGFYLTRAGIDNELVLGPFIGNPACIRIEFGKGVCGTAANTKIAQLVDDVHTFPGHIACDSASNSEIVVPIIVNDVVKGVIDIDSTGFATFKNEDLKALQRIAELVADGCDWTL
eukprot:TRINITY_DN662_c0_g1_i1.p1 TRINITY_DN662_c0_g1~~TRINITY_DN662_c0_g1_i1.p1  ORF type:complete len:157 (+),score=33.37 TRINITY_DN662_c0_g1_i1:48-518(+)